MTEPATAVDRSTAPTTPPATAPAASRPRPLPATAPAIVIGAGPAGLAVAAELRSRGVPAVNLDRAEQVGASWRGHYDRLRLHTVRWLSHLPGHRIPRAYGPWVARDDVVRYLEAYSRERGVELIGGTTVQRVERDGAGWVVRTDRGEIRGPVVVVATGHNHTPHLPDWPGRETFTGQLLHAHDYRNGAPYRGRDVLVVGAGNSGAEIAVDLVEHGAARVRLAVRTPPHVMRRAAGGIPTTLVSVLTRYIPPRLGDPIAARMQRITVGDLSKYGLASPPVGVFTNLRDNDQVPILDVGLVAALRSGTVQVVPAVDRVRRARGGARRRQQDRARRGGRGDRLRARARRPRRPPRGARPAGPPDRARVPDAGRCPRALLHGLHESDQRHVPRARDRRPQDRPRGGRPAAGPMTPLTAEQRLARGHGLGDLLHRTALRDPDRSGLVFGDRAYTFAELDEAVDRLAAALAGPTGSIGAGDRVALLSHNCDYFVLA